MPETVWKLVLVTFLSVVKWYYERILMSQCFFLVFVRHVSQRCFGVCYILMHIVKQYTKGYGSKRVVRSIDALLQPESTKDDLQAQIIFFLLLFWPLVFAELNKSDNNLLE